MSTTYGAAGLGPTAASTRRVSSFFKRYWDAFQARRKERRKRQRERAELYRLNDWELMDIGMTRGEIEYVVSNRSFDREASGPLVR
jgi:uncharacterized protein YjiS (DUF1127 family)